MELSLNKLPWHAQLGTFAVLAAVIVGLFYWRVELPMRADIAARDAQLQMLQRDIAKGQQTARQLPQFRAQVEELEGRLENLRAVLPEEKDAADLLRRMQTVAVQSNLTLRGFKPQAVATRQLHAEWPISLELEGTYHDLAVFFDRVGKSARIVNITGLTVRGKDRSDQRATISASCLATTFVLLDKPAQKGAKAGKKAA